VRDIIALFMVEVVITIDDGVYMNELFLYQRRMGIVIGEMRSSPV
jgi:hypothetical protein